MRKAPLLLAAALLSVAAFAQKVDLDKFHYSATFRALPQKPLDPSYRTYSVVINATESIRNNYPPDQMKNNLPIHGWKRVENNGHVVLTFHMQDLIIENVDIKTREEEIKDKDGKVTGKKYYYSAQAIYNWAGNFDMTDYKGNNIHKWVLTDRNSKRSWNSQEYATRDEAANYYNNNKYQIRTELTTNLINSSLTTVQNALNTDYGFRPMKDQDFLWILDSKKHDEHDAQKANWTIFKEAMKMMNENDSLGAVREKLQPAIAYFEDIKKRVTGTEKNDKKLRYGAYYALAKIYLWLDQPEEAIKQAEGLIANDYDTKDGKKLIEEAEFLKKVFEANKIYTRHFAIDVSGFQPPVK